MGWIDLTGRGYAFACPVAMRRVRTRAPRLCPGRKAVARRRAGLWRAARAAFALLLTAALLSTARTPALAQSSAEGSSSEPQRQLIIGTKDAPPFAMQSPDGKWRGVSVALWKHVADQLHLSYRFEEAKSIDELLANVAGGKYDAAVAAITVTAAREKTVDFSQPFYATGLGIAVSASGADLWNSVKRVFLSFGFAQAILALVTLAVVVGTLVWVFERRTEHFGAGAKGLGSGVWWSAIAMTQAGASHNAPATLPGRILAVAWMIASVVTIAVFTAGITSSLTKREIQGTVQSQADLNSARVGVVSGSAAEDYLIHRRVSCRAYATANDGLKALQEGRIDAFVHDKPLLSWIVLQNFSSSVRILDTSFAGENYAVAFPKGSALRAAVDSSLLENVEEEWWQETLFQYLGKK
jgi:polar amino acid transport system substrate-binding protein